MPEDEKVSPLETLRRRLYATKSIDDVAASSLRTKGQGRSFGWKAPSSSPATLEKGSMPFATKFLIVAIAFFILAGAGAAALLIFGGRSISTTHVNVLVQGPPTIASGDTVALVVSVQNDNPIAIKNTTVTVDLPEGTRSPEDPTQPFPHYTDTLGDIPSGATASRTVRAVLFGAENQAIQIPVHLQYQTEGSNATSVKEGSYTLTVTTSPLSVNVSTVGETASGQPLSVTVAVRSNAATALDNVGVVGEYPFGFTFTSANPAPTSGSFFSLGTFAPGETKNITVSGTLAGQEKDQRVFRFTAGTIKSDGSPALGLSYTSNQASVGITKPFLGILLTVNRQSDDTVVVPAGTPLAALLSWSNSLTTPVNDAQVSVRFGGTAFNPSSVSTQNGFYNSTNSTLLFSKDTNPGLASLQPNDSGAGSFAVTPKSGVRNPNITMAITVSGKRAGTGGGIISATINRTVLISTNASLSSQVVRTNSPFSNTGPYPPQADTETTYTVQLSAASSINTIGGATVSMKLPAYARYTGQTNASGTAIAYDETTRTVTWTIGDLVPGSPKQGSFQVALLPSASQKGTSPVLVEAQTLTGTDRFTKTSVSGTAPALVAGTVQ